MLVGDEMSIKQIADLYATIADSPEMGIKPDNLPVNYTINGTTVTVPVFKPGATQMAQTVPIPQPETDQAMKATLLFEGNGGGWSESLVICYPQSEGDPYARMRTFLETYVPNRLSVLSDTNQIIGCRISLAANPGAFEPVEQPFLGMGPGTLTGPPADINNGLLYRFADASRRINKSDNFSGWAQADMNMTTSAARDRSGAGPKQQLWSTLLKQMLIPVNGIYIPQLGGGKPCIPAKPKGDGAAQKEIISSWTDDAAGRLVAHTPGQPAGWDKGARLQIMYKRNKIVRGFAGIYDIIDSKPGTGDWITTISARRCVPLESMNAVNMFGRVVLTRYYPIAFQTIGNYSRRTNGAQFFVHRGRRSRGC